MPRPDKYFTHIEPNLDKIEKMALTMSEEQIAKTLGVGITAWKKYKRLYPTINDRLKKGRQQLVIELKSTLIRKAKGFQFEESKKIKENGKIVREEIFSRVSLPDVAALNLLLKNYDKDNWSNDPQMLDIKKREVEIKEAELTKGETADDVPRAIESLADSLFKPKSDSKAKSKRKEKE